MTRGEGGSRAPLKKSKSFVNEPIMHRNYTRKKFIWKPNLLKNHICLGTNQGVFWKGETKGYLNMKKQIVFIEKLNMYE